MKRQRSDSEADVRGDAVPCVNWWRCDVCGQVHVGSYSWVPFWIGDVKHWCCEDCRPYVAHQLATNQPVRLFREP